MTVIFKPSHIFTRVFILLILVATQPAWSATIYLSNSGNDSNDGSTWDLAKQTLAAALAAAGSGDVIMVTNGTYISTHFAIDWVKSGETLRSVNGPAYTFIDRYDTSMPVIRVEGTIDGFTVRNGSTSSSYKGGGIMLIGGVAVNCVVSNCTAGGDGGGIYIDSGGVVSNCIIVGNTASANCGGVYIKDGLLTHSTVINNTAGNRAGGVLITTSMEADNCIIRNNQAVAEGGGVYVYSSGILRNCLVVGNQTAGNGGGVFTDGATTESCTIIGNTTTASGGGLYATMGGTTVRNNIMYYNETSDAYLSLSVTLQNSCLGVGVDTPSLSGGNSITNDPEFVTAGSGYGTNHVFGNYWLRPTSPCVDTGLNQAWMSTATDLAGTNRIIDSTVNMGAYEATATGKDPQTITFPAIANQTKSSIVRLAATASSGLPVSFSVVSGPAVLSGGTNLSFTSEGTVSVKASQAGDDTYDPAPDVTRSFFVLGSFSFRATALTNSVVLRWSSPGTIGFSNENVLVRYDTSDYPDTTVDGSSLYTGTNVNYTHNGLTPGQPYYYTVFYSQDGSSFTNPP